MGPFLTLAFSGLALGIVFLGVGLAVSTFCRTRVQALVLALLAWCGAVFVFDLVALGVLLSTRAPVATQEIEALCDTTHVNAAADIHSAYVGASASGTARLDDATGSSFSWVLVNPVDLFRAVNLADQMNLNLSPVAVALAVILWLGASVGLSFWRFRRLDL